MASPGATRPAAGRGLARLVIVMATCAIGCWTGKHVPGPAPWRTSNVVDVLPSGAWLVAALDADGSAVQLEREANARRAPRAVRNGEGGCSFPSTHVALGVYEGNDIVVASRGGFHRAALLDCIAQANGSHRTAVGGLPTVEVRSPEGEFALTATDHGMVVGASSVPLLQRTVETRAWLDTDRQLAALVRAARGRGELWVAARVPRGSSAIARVLRALEIEPVGRVISIVGALRLQAPFRVEIALEVDGGAAELARALEQRRSLASTLVDADLAPIIDAVRVVAEGNTVRIVGDPANLDPWKLLPGLLRTVAAFSSRGS